MTDSIAVVGGGLAGLAAATWLARAGATVSLFEGSAALGGRATTQEAGGVLLNQGPHALYRGGAAMAALRDLGLKPAGRRPPSAAFGLRGDLDEPLPAGPLSFWTSPLLEGTDRLRFGSLMARACATPNAAAGTSLGHWLADRDAPPAVADLVRASVRVATYCADDGVDAGAAFTQLASALRNGVLYLDGGWQQLVDGLQEQALDAGVRIHTGARVRRLDGLRLVGPDAAFDRVVLAVPLPAAARLLPDHAALQAEAAQAVPTRAACLDLGLSQLPVPDMALRLGIDEPWYVSIHSGHAELGGPMLHVARYLAPAEDRPPAGIRAELEALADRLQPGWREFAVAQRFGVMPVQSASVQAPRGLAGRPRTDFLGLPGVAVCGDWVGPEGLLLDGVLASARQAVAETLARRAA